MLKPSLIALEPTYIELRIPSPAPNNFTKLGSTLRANLHFAINAVHRFLCRKKQTIHALTTTPKPLQHDTMHIL